MTRMVDVEPETLRALERAVAGGRFASYDEAIMAGLALLPEGDGPDGYNQGIADLYDLNEVFDALDGSPGPREPAR